jgi:putative transposase
MTVIRYIHNNPIKAKIVNAPEGYPWSSIHAYYGSREDPDGLTTTDIIMKIIHEQQTEAIKGFRDFMQQDNKDQCLDDHMKKRKTDSEVKEKIEAIMNGEPIVKIANCSCDRN